MGRRGGWVIPLNYPYLVFNMVTYVCKQNILETKTTTIKKKKIIIIIIIQQNITPDQTDNVMVKKNTTYCIFYIYIYNTVYKFKFSALCVWLKIK